jgi:hypothetical protein
MDATLILTGTNFYPGIELDLGTDVFVHTITLSGQTSINAHVSIFASAPPGLRDVRVINRDGQYATRGGAFEVRPTTRHYYSPSGSNHSPYVTPVDAATTLQTAIEATYAGDTLFVVSGTFDDFTIIIERGILLHGAWNNSFTAQNLETGKTILNLTSNVTFLGAGGAAGLDGFLLQNGTGAYDFTPFPAYFGGAVRFIGGTAILANCEIRSSSVGASMDYGVGGAVFADGCTVDMRDNYIHDNSATQGGAVYLRGCAGNLANNTIANNSLTAASQRRLGAGIVLVNSSNVALVENTITGNIQAEDGGGIYVENTAGVTMTGGAVSGNGASFSGGGVVFKNSTAMIDGVDFLGNSSTTIGGALSSMDASGVTVTGSSFVSNTGLIGGGIYAVAGQFSLRHSLFAANNAPSSGGAMVISAMESGEIVGNTLDGNTSGAVAGMLVGSSAIEVFNNIIANSTGVGMSCSGAPPAVLSYNLMWNNTGGNYSGCSPGVGSLSSDPLFVDPADDDLHLGLHSPAIDAGRPGPAYVDPDGSRGDMGFYGSHAFQMDQPSYPKDLSASFDSGRVRLTWRKNPEGDVSGYAVYSGVTEHFVPSILNFATLVPSADSTVTLDLPTDSVYYRISAVDASGYASGYSALVAFSSATAIDDHPGSYVFALRQNVPNPFNPVTRISYELPVETEVSLSVYDVEGRLVRKLVDSVEGPGSFSVTWEAVNDRGLPVASGVYFYRLQAGSRTETRKMAILK